MHEALQIGHICEIEGHSHGYNEIVHRMDNWQDIFNGSHRILQRSFCIWKDRTVEKYGLLAADSSASPLPTWRFSARRRKLLLVLTALATTILLTSFIRRPAGEPQSLPAYSSSGPVHPIFQLAQRADQEFRLRREAQSTNLDDAVEEYWRRYHIPPPPHFDEWYKFAVARNTVLIDGFNTINDSLALFWAISPGTIRKRTLDALGYDNSLMGVSIRGGLVTTHGSGQGDFQASATNDMILSFATWLPDMDLAFNVNDEPRVIITHEDAERMLSLTKTAKKSVRLRINNFTATQGIILEQGYEPVAETLFTHLDHQATWSFANSACAPGSPARSLEDVTDDTETMFSFQGIDFIDDTLRYSDVCLRPSVREVIGLFKHPNVFSATRDLVPIFSPSKLSTFGDILYPSPYYYAQKSRYDPDLGVSWEEKLPKLYWRGATSGGFSEGGIWKSFLRQSILQKLVSQDSVWTLSKNHGDQANDPWIRADTPGLRAIDRYDAQFSEIKQCDWEDCLEMGARLGYHPHEPLSNAWNNRYLLDMDGNGLSGRFYAFLQSQSLPLKVAYFREWHIDRIFPWKHFVPLSSSTEEYAEVFRYFEEDEEGQRIARDLAEQGRDWANRTLRKEDMEVYLFRLLLEYARLIDDNRSGIGYG